jgi:hypothetical protein
MDGQNGLGVFAVGRASVHAATNPRDGLRLAAQSREQIADPKVFDFPLAGRGQQMRSAQKAGIAAATAVAATGHTTLTCLRIASSKL